MAPHHDSSYQSELLVIPMNKKTDPTAKRIVQTKLNERFLRIFVKAIEKPLPLFMCEIIKQLYCI
jgi:hypothetical protein